MPDRRGARRFNVGWLVRVRGIDSVGRAFSGTGHLRDLSSSGAFIHLDIPLKVGEELDVRIRLPFQKENWMAYPAEVVRIEDCEARAGVGMRFCAVWPTFNSD